MMLLGQASKRLESAAELTFPGALPVDHQGVTYPSLVGWRFQGDGRVTAWVVNLSGEAQEVAFDLAAALLVRAGERRPRAPGGR